MQDSSDNTELDSAGPSFSELGVAGAARTGVRWLAAESAVSQVIQLATSIALARLLVPDDFGLIAMAVAVGGLARAVGDFGISALIVQREDLDPGFLPAAFTLNAALFLSLAVFQVLLAPIGGLILEDSRVVWVIAALALALPFQGLSSFAQALLRRDLAFSKIAKLNLVAVVVSSVVACSLAVLGFGVWSLVAAQIAAPIVIALLAWRMTSFGVGVDVSAAKRWSREILGFGRFATGNSLVNYLVHNLDYLLIGRLLPTAQLGFYYFAFEKSRVFSRRILGLYSSLSLPVYSRLNPDRERIRRAYRTATAATVFLIAPIVTFLAVHAALVIPLVFGEKWTPSVIVFQILSVHVVVNALTSGIGSVFYAVGRPDISFRIVRWIVIPLGMAYFLGARFAGIVGVALAVTVIKSAFSLIKLEVCFRFLRWKWLPTLRPALVVIAGATVAGLSSFGLAGLMPLVGGWARLLLEAVVYGT
ncbi:MAG: lipopolysaccharide biosynthesis protein, partial [Thermoanaerobaculia bacterium]